MPVLSSVYGARASPLYMGFLGACFKRGKEVMRVVVLSVITLSLVSCSPPLPLPPDGTNNTNTNIINIFGPTPVTSPSPGGSGELPPGSFIRVGMFGQTCPSGVTVPSNASRQVKPNCTASITATPKDGQGNDLPAAVHGPNIAWSIPSGSGVVNCLADSEPFNRTCRCIGLGQFTLQATVKDLTGFADFECVS